MWKDGDDLPGKVTEALRHQIEEDEDDDAARPGWFRGDRVPSAAALDEFARLSEDSAALREENARLKAALVAMEGGVYAEIKALIEEGRTRILLNNPIGIGAEMVPLTAPTGKANLTIVALEKTLLRTQVLTHRKRGFGNVMGEGLPAIIPLSLVEGAYADPTEPDLLHLRLKASLCLLDGRWALR